MTSANPVLVEVMRGKQVESRHRGACAVVRANGEIVQAWGDVEALVYPRSALKPIQALPLIDTGAADYFAVTPPEIALACASHSSEAFHVDQVTAWLARLGLGVEDLECGPGGAGTCEALSLNVTKSMSRAGETFTRAHNNCSGKHTGFLTTALHLGEPTKGYIDAPHPVQLRVSEAVEELTGVALTSVPCGTDGCGIPVYAIPLQALALGMARMVGGELGTARTAAALHITSAMAAHPLCVAGTGRFDSRVMSACGGKVLTKGGAEGVHIAMLPRLGMGIALKMDDGTVRASELAMACVLDGLGFFDASVRPQLLDLIEQPIKSTLGERVGEIRRGPGLVF